MLDYLYEEGINPFMYLKLQSVEHLAHARGKIKAHFEG